MTDEQTVLAMAEELSKLADTVAEDVYEGASAGQVLADTAKVLRCANELFQKQLDLMGGFIKVVAE